MIVCWWDQAKSNTMMRKTKQSRQIILCLLFATPESMKLVTTNGRGCMSAWGPDLAWHISVTVTFSEGIFCRGWVEGGGACLGWPFCWDVWHISGEGGTPVWTWVLQRGGLADMYWNLKGKIIESFCKVEIMGEIKGGLQDESVSPGFSLPIFSSRPQFSLQSG